jgi:putative acetyltransferase
VKDPTIEIILASTERHFSDAQKLILEYVEWLNFDLSFQNFDLEMASLPAMYNIKDGGLFIVYSNGEPSGVIGLRRFSATDGEVKRMFVKETARGHGIGKLLLLKCIDTAKALRYASLKLDTADFMKAAHKLYIDHGFVEIPAYRFNPHEGARFFELDLRKKSFAPDSIK